MTDDKRQAYLHTHQVLAYRASVLATKVWKSVSPTMLKSSEQRSGNPKSATMWLLAMHGCRGNREEFVRLLGSKGIDVVFRENDAGRIYGVTFIDHHNREVYNGSRLGKEFSANNFEKLFNLQGDIPWTDMPQGFSESPQPLIGRP